mmetsp:Transcript_9474/g.25547  ORF Transcript_9474/g.25547 Transcript_9474/m.25547 type:complete len:157 (-) Transcript_9474:5-475(-)
MSTMPESASRTRPSVLFTRYAVSGAPGMEAIHTSFRVTTWCWLLPMEGLLSCLRSWHRTSTRPRSTALQPIMAMMWGSNLSWELWEGVPCCCPHRISHFVPISTPPHPLKPGCILVSVVYMLQKGAQGQIKRTLTNDSWDKVQCLDRFIIIYRVIA